MIPEVVHWIWLSGDDLPPLVQQCLESWNQALPGFEIRKWDLQAIRSLSSCQWLEQAISLKRWAFASDYLRIAILHKHGGIYLDSDVYVQHNLRLLTGYQFVSAIEFHPEVFSASYSDCLVDASGSRLASARGKSLPGLGVQAAFLMSKAGHPYLSAIKSFYESASYVLEDGGLNESEIAPGIYALVAEKFGFKWIDSMQSLDESIILLPTSCVGGTPRQVNSSTLAFHCCANSWRR